MLELAVLHQQRTQRPPSKIQDHERADIAGDDAPSLHIAVQASTGRMALVE